MGGFAIAACNDTLYHYLGKLIPRRKIRYDVPPLLPRAAVRHDGCRPVLRLPDPLPRAAAAPAAPTRPQRLAVVAKIGRAHVCTPATNAHLVWRLLLVKKTKYII